MNDVRRLFTWVGACALAALILLLAVGCGGDSAVGGEGDQQVEDAGADDVGVAEAGTDAAAEPDAQQDAAPEADVAHADSPWRAAQGYDIAGAGADRAVVTLTRSEGGFGEKPGGGPPLLWDFGTEVYVNGEPDSFNAGLDDGQDVENSPLYGSESPRKDPVFETTGEHLREGSRGHYLGRTENQDGAKSGAYFMGVAATGGKTSEPAPFRDNRYYYSFRQVYPEGENDNSLKTMRGSQRDSQQHGWYGSVAGNINKNGWSYRDADGQLIWPPPQDNGYAVPTWINRPSGDVRQWHLQEMLIDPTGQTEPDRIYNVWYIWFADTGRNEWLPSMRVDPDGNEVGRWTPTEYWDDSRGFYHQVGPEPAGYDQPDYYFGEIYVDDSWRRLYLADASSWSEARKVELQRPISWQDGAIEFALNLGALHTQDELYLYWVDPSNQATLAGTLELGTNAE